MSIRGKLGSVVWAWMMMGLSGASCAWAGTRIVEIATRTPLSAEQLAHRLSAFDTVVMGEKHYTPAVQALEGEIILSTSALQANPSDFTLGWEFLNFSEGERDQTLYADVLAGKLSAEKFLELTQGVQNAGLYVPIIEAARVRGAQLLGLNLTRAEKAPILKGGLQALDPALIPAGFEMGGRGYFERFAEVMQGHATPEKLQRYFEAQCLTDDVMAFHLTRDSTRARRFVVAGSFHVDFRDATVARYLARSPQARVATVRIFDAEDFGDMDLSRAMELVLHDDRYGDVADYAAFVNVRE